MVNHMMAAHANPDIPNPFHDWVPYDRTWGTWSEPCSTLEEARDVAARTGGGPVYRRTWHLEPES